MEHRKADKERIKQEICRQPYEKANVLQCHGIVAQPEKPEQPKERSRKHSKTIEKIKKKKQGSGQTMGMYAACVSS